MKRAVELDAELVEPRVSLALVRLVGDWDWRGAEREARRAVELGPNNPSAHFVLSAVLGLTGRFEEAIAAAERCRELDPLWVDAYEYLGYYQRAAGRAAEAEAEWKRAIEIDSSVPMPHVNLGNQYCAQGRFDEAFAQFEKALSVAPDEPIFAAQLAVCHARAGAPERARAILAELDAGPYVSPIHPAAIHVALGEIDEAFARLEQAYALRAPLLLGVGVNPDFAALRSDSRFADLLRRLGLPETLVELHGRVPEGTFHRSDAMDSSVIGLRSAASLPGRPETIALSTTWVWRRTDGASDLPR